MSSQHLFSCNNVSILPKCNTDYLENGPNRVLYNVIYHFYSSKVAASEIREIAGALKIGSKINEYLRVFLFYAWRFQMHYSEYQEERPTKNCACRQWVVFPDSCRCLESWRPFNKIAAPEGIHDILHMPHMPLFHVLYFNFFFLRSKHIVIQDKSSSIAHLPQWWNDSGWLEDIVFKCVNLHSVLPCKLLLHK